MVEEFEASALRTAVGIKGSNAFAYISLFAKQEVPASTSAADADGQFTKTLQFCPTVGTVRHF
jgi:hypothetical protein